MARDTVSIASELLVQIWQGQLRTLQSWADGEAAVVERRTTERKKNSWKGTATFILRQLKSTASKTCRLDCESFTILRSINTYIISTSVDDGPVENSSSSTQMSLYAVVQPPCPAG